MVGFVELTIPPVAYVDKATALIIEIKDENKNPDRTRHIVDLRFFDSSDHNPLPANAVSIDNLPRIPTEDLGSIHIPVLSIKELVVWFNVSSWHHGGHFVIEASLLDAPSFHYASQEIKVFSRRSISSHKRKQNVFPTDGVESLDGIGPTYSKRLKDLGISTVQKMAELSSVEVHTIRIRQQRGHMTNDKLIALWNQAREICNEQSKRTQQQTHTNGSGASKSSDEFNMSTQQQQLQQTVSDSPIIGNMSPLLESPRPTPSPSPSPSPAPSPLCFQPQQFPSPALGVLTAPSKSPSLCLPAPPKLFLTSTPFTSTPSTSTSTPATPSTPLSTQPSDSPSLFAQVPYSPASSPTALSFSGGKRPILTTRMSNRATAPRGGETSHSRNFDLDLTNLVRSRKVFLVRGVQ